MKTWMKRLPSSRRLVLRRTWRRCCVIRRCWALRALLSNREAMMEEELAKKAEVLKNLALVSSAQSDYDASLGYAESALELYEKLGDKQKILRAHMDILTIYSVTGREDLALEHLEAVKVMVEEDPDSVEKGLLYQRMAHVYLHLGQPATALSWAQRVVDIFTGLGVPMGTRLKAASSLGTALLYTGLID